METEWMKACPMCGGQMNFHTDEKMWMCYSCAYEEFADDEVQDKYEEKSDHTISPESGSDSDPISEPYPPLADPLASQSSNEYQKSIKESSPFNDPSTKTKNCPVCHKKMYWHPTEKAWRCPSCQSERRI
jgi:ribosomal protein L37AE/L43A